MSKEGELVKETKDLLAQPTGDTIIGIWRDGYDAGKRLAKPEQEPVAWLLSSKTSIYTELRKTEPFTTAQVA